MTSSGTSPIAEGQSTPKWRPVTWLVVRGLVFGAFLCAGFGGLTILSNSRRVGDGLQRNEVALATALAVGVSCLPVAAIAGLVTECHFLLLASPGVSWWAWQIAYPLVWSLFGGFFAWFLFQLPEHGPHETLLVTGGALVFFVGTAVHLELWHATGGRPDSPEDLPGGWYAVLIVLIATFCGSLRGWVDGSPHVGRLLEYRKQHWASEGPPLPAPMQPLDEPPPLAAGSQDVDTLALSLSWFGAGSGGLSGQRKLGAALSGPVACARPIDRPPENERRWGA